MVEAEHVLETPSHLTPQALALWSAARGYLEREQAKPTASASETRWHIRVKEFERHESLNR
jgi:hypothetical protein